MLILSVDDANAVRGLTVLGHALAPVPMADGRLILPEECATDPHHAIHAELLATMPRGSRGTVDDPRWPDPDIVAACTYDSSWPVAELIFVAF